MTAIGRSRRELLELPYMDVNVGVNIIYQDYRPSSFFTTSSVVITPLAI